MIPFTSIPRAASPLPAQIPEWGTRLISQATAPKPAGPLFSKSLARGDRGLRARNDGHLTGSQLGAPISRNGPLRRPDIHMGWVKHFAQNPQIHDLP